MTVWGPELNKQTIQKKSSLPHGEKGNRKTVGGSSVLDKVGEKLFQKFSSAPSTPFKTKQIMVTGYIIFITLFKRCWFKKAKNIYSSI